MAAQPGVGDGVVVTPLTLEVNAPSVPLSKPSLNKVVSAQAVAVGVGLRVFVAVGVRVNVGVGVFVIVGVLVAVGVLVGSGVLVGVVHCGVLYPTAMSSTYQPALAPPVPVTSVP